MLKFAIILFVFCAAAASGIAPLVTSQSAVIRHYSPYNYFGNGISSRYQTKADYGYGIGLTNPIGIYGTAYYGGNAYDGIDNFGLAYNQYDLSRPVVSSGLFGLGGYGLSYGFNELYL